jgi:hypothetical protein
MMLDLLAQILDDAVEYGLPTANPARGKRRRLKVLKPCRTFLEPDMVVDLLDVADEWERSPPPHPRYGRRAFVATLCLAGPRISELTQTTVAPRPRRRRPRPCGSRGAPAGGHRGDTPAMHARDPATRSIFAAPGDPTRHSTAALEAHADRRPVDHQPRRRRARRASRTARRTGARTGVFLTTLQRRRRGAAVLS